MPKVWIIAPADAEDVDQFPKIWAYQRGNGFIAIGWDMGDSSSLSRSEVMSKFIDYADEYGWNPRERHQYAKFWLDIKKHDLIIARQGRKRIVGIGKVMGQAYFERHKFLERSGKPGDPLTSLIRVDWQFTQEYDFSDTVFSILTVSQPRKRWPQIRKVLSEFYGITIP